ncbi:APC family permease [Brevibacillus sp. SAFN-007a]|uniref:APC family permease n=1 Tax=Brevibacillus sp. SAFN-007a TaxID=3436862 RepID=UPI003F7D46C2
MISKFKRFLLGRPMKSNELAEEKLNKGKALAVLSSDALSSVAYGTEQILLVLVSLGAVALWYSIPISMAVVGLLTILILSYRQTIFAYTTGGGAYIVAKDNLGTTPGLIAGGSLLVDYILTVAVSTSASTDAITSAFPVLHEHRVLIALLMITLITVLHLRGVTESATILMYPVYLFVVAILALIVGGAYQWITGNIQAHPPEYGAVVPGITVFLLLRAFSSGCSALTGVEAVSNAIPNFKEPAPRNAALTLVMMGVILGVMFMGISLLAYLYGISPSPEETVVSKIASAVFGRGTMYYAIQAATALILFLAANTAFAAFPLLAFMLAKDRFMPNMFMVRGDRLGFSNGIIFLAILSAIVVIAFEGETENLIPLYALGVFIPFTLSQAGMMKRWISNKPPGWLAPFLINTVGMLTTLTICLIFLMTKFSQVWAIFVFLPIVLFIFKKINQHYRELAEELRLDIEADKPEPKGSVIVIPVAGISQVVKNTISYAQSLSDDIVAVYVAFSEEDMKKMEEKWARWDPGVRLIILRSHYRSIIKPLSKFIDTVEWKKAETDHVTVMIPQFITRRWWHNLLHNQTSLLIRAYLFARQDVKIATVPYRLKK